MKLVPLIIGCVVYIGGLLLFFGAWGARLVSLIDTSLLIIFNLSGFFIMVVSFFVILIALVYPDGEIKQRRTQKRRQWAML